VARWELTGKRPEVFSVWHRQKLPHWCRLADGDWFEVRHNQVVAVVETIMVKPGDFPQAGQWVRDDPWQKCWYPRYDRRYALWETKKVVLNWLLGVTRVRVFIIYHTPDMSRIRVIDYRKKKVWEFNERQFADFLQML
jgi:hypothetical protein